MLNNYTPITSDATGTGLDLFNLSYIEMNFRLTNKNSQYSSSPGWG